MPYEWQEALSPLFKELPGTHMEPIRHPFAERLNTTYKSEIKNEKDILYCHKNHTIIEHRPELLHGRGWRLVVWFRRHDTTGDSPGAILVTTRTCNVLHFMQDTSLPVGKNWVMAERYFMEMKLESVDWQMK